MSNQSSVDWLAEQLKEKMQMWNSMKNYQEFHIVLEAGEFAKLIEQAKAMRKEEMCEFAFKVGRGQDYDDEQVRELAEIIYNETFGK